MHPHPEKARREVSLLILDMTLNRLMETAPMQGMPNDDRLGPHMLQWFDSQQLIDNAKAQEDRYDRHFQQWAVGTAMG